MKAILLTEEQEKEIIDYYLEPHSIANTAKQFNVGRRIIEKIIRLNNLPKWSKEETDKMRGQQLHLTTETMPAEARAKHAKNISNGRKVFWQNLSAEEKQHISEQHRQIMLNMPEDKKQASIEKGRLTLSNTLKNRTKDEVANWAAKVTVTCANRSDSEVKASNEKRKQTCLEKYGVDAAIKLDEVKQKRADTNIKKYGNPCYLHSETGIIKVKQSNLEKFGFEYASQAEEIKNKSFLTKKANNSFNTSAPEENFYAYLCDIYQADDIIRQYSDDRYPFHCDFYIKSLDLFIELNCSWTHGKHRFDHDNKEDQQLLESWKAKGTEYYESAINTWTVRDIKKFQTAEENKLNYKVIYFDEYEKLIKGEIPWKI